MTEKEVYEFYNDITKVIYVDIEARGNVVPVELLFEIHAAFDHLKRLHLNEKAEQECCEKAVSHLKRGALDGYKIILRDFHKSYETLIGKDIAHLRTVDNGNFLPKMMSLRTEIFKTAKQARTQEGIVDREKAFDDWNKVYRLIREFEDEFFDEEKIGWAKGEDTLQKKRALSREFVLTLFSGILAGILATSIYNYFF
jgi:hypothetical protein